MDNTARKSGALLATAALIAGLGIPAVLATSANAGPATRIQGDDRFSTAIEISKAAYAPKGDTIAGKRTASVAYVTRADDFIDALTASRLTDGPVLFLAAGKEQAVKAEVARLKVDEVIALGGTTAVPEALLTAVANGKKTSRIDGADRFTTAANIAKRVIGTGTPNTVLLARADVYADALAASMIPSPAADPKPILLVSGDTLPAATAAQIKAMSARNFIALGGPAAVSDKALNEAAYGTAAVGTDAVKAAEKKADDAALYLNGWKTDATTTVTTKPYVAAANDAERAGFAVTPAVSNTRSANFAGWTYLKAKAQATYERAIVAKAILADAANIPGNDTAIPDAKIQTVVNAAYDLVAKPYPGAYPSTTAALKSAPTEIFGTIADKGANPELALSAADKAKVLAAADAQIAILRTAEANAAAELKKATDAKAEADRAVTLAKQSGSASTTSRLGGGDRYATAAAISQYTVAGANKAVAIYTARGDGANNTFADAVVAGALRPVDTTVATLMLVPQTGALPAAVTNEVKRVANASSKVVGLGGPAAVSDAVLNAVNTAAGL
ncbi:MAG: cell wall-binding repeat-containing protein [Actinomycetaceae bacterium]|nr:cell wall-binding repeat-containing protein [Actinomycetaceae bacterium]